MVELLFIYLVEVFVFLIRIGASIVKAKGSGEINFQSFQVKLIFQSRSEAIDWLSSKYQAMDEEAWDWAIQMKVLYWLIHRIRNLENI